LGNRGYSSGTAVRPNIQGSCFSTVSDYNHWQNYYYYLFSTYSIPQTYFTRFTRNYEPKLTPAMLKIGLREPLIMTREMLRAIDELEAMIDGSSPERVANKDAIVAKSQEIRDLAKEIRQNQTISIIDVSSNKAAPAVLGNGALDAEAIAKLREMALDLNRQLTNLYSQSNAATVSADSFRAPSFMSTAKAIEKMCKDIANASKRL
jgi:hypothetical protein